jgi:hypothetical protein
VIAQVRQSAGVVEPKLRSFEIFEAFDSIKCFNIDRTGSGFPTTSVNIEVWGVWDAVLKFGARHRADWGDLRGTE